MSNQKTHTKQYVDANPIESFRGISSAIGKTVVDEVAKASINDLWNQILGAESYSQKKHTAGDLAAGQELDLSSLQQNVEKTKAHVEAGWDYRSEVLHFDKRDQQKENQIIHSSVQEIVIELKRLASSSKTLEVMYKEVTTEQRMEKPGKYHVAFFEYMLTVIRAARMKVEDAGAWLASVKNKKGQKQYWNQFKKHGTSFSLNNERTVTTQTG